MSPVLLGLGAATAYALGGACMKLSEGLSQAPYTLLVYVCFTTGATLQALGLRERELGTTYVLVIGFEAMLAYGLAVLAFGESATPLRIAGVLLVLSGMSILH